MTIPGVEERVVGGVRVRTVVREDERVVDEPLAVETVEVERVPLGRWIESAPAVRQEGVPLLTPEGRDQEPHPLYVAATRARRGLEPNGAVRGCLAVAGTQEGPAGGPAVPQKGRTA